MLTTLPLLSLLIWLPVVAGGVILLLPRTDNAAVARWLALVTTGISLGICWLMYANFDPATPAMQFVEQASWIPSFKINYSLGVDGVSLALILLTTFTTLVIILASWHLVTHKVTQYLAAFLVMQGMMVGIFAAMDAILFYLFWEAVLIPIYLAIGIWGSANRSYAALKFFVYTFVASGLFLIALIYLGLAADSFLIRDLYDVPLALWSQKLIFIAFLLAFAVKVPMWPMHTWLPDAHTEAPAGGSVILAALMLKAGVYGFLRFSLPIVPDAAMAFSGLMIALSLVAIIYIGLVAIIQKDMKRLIAYSSVAHMGFSTLGCFMIYAIFVSTGEAAYTQMSLEGGMFQMISHAFSSGALFVGIGILYDQLHTRDIQAYGGVAHVMPVFSALFMIFILSNIGLPGTAGFVGEFMVIISSFQANFWIAFAAAITLILGAIYSLWLYKRIFYGEVASPQVAALKDVRGPSAYALILLVIPVLFFGCYPVPLLELFQSPAGELLQLSLRSKLL